MSLNGLDSPEVTAAYQTAIAEAAGWFLLQYVSRDGVELLAHGRNGVSEARNAITAYTQASPLYGLINYRRRRLLIKYIPEGTSRLLQARTSVHFQDILERYSPYETLLEITTGEALNDTALAKTFQLHTASPSPSVSVGRLDEITEDGEDAGAEGGSSASVNVSSSSLSAAQRYKTARRGDNLSKRAERADRSANSLQVGGATPPSLSPRLSPRSTLSSAPLDSSSVQSLSRENSGPTTIAESEPTTIAETDSVVDKTPASAALENEPSAAPPRTSDLLDTATERLTDDPVQQVQIPEASSNITPDVTNKTNPSTPPVESLRGEDAGASHSPDPTMSEASSSIRGMSMDDDPYDLRKYDSFFKPKVKLGPRPVTAAERALRPARVSAVPASFRNARKQEIIRPQSQGNGDMAPAQPASAVRPTPPPIPDYSPRPYSRGSVKSAPSHRSSAMTPDRLRLQKAVELRKRQLRKSQEPSSFIPPIEDPPEMPSLLLHTVSEPLTTTLNKLERNEDGKAEQSITDDESHHQSSKADSGIEIRYERPSLDDTGERTPSVPEDTAVHHSQTDTVDEQRVPAVPAAASEDIGKDSPSPAPQEDSTSVDQQIPVEPTITPPEEDASPPDVPSTELVNGSTPQTSEENAHLAANDLAHAPSSDTLRSIEPASRPVSSDLSRRRRGLVEPLHIAMPSGNPDDFMSDDEFLEELHSATVQEARPILFAHQPSMEDISTVKSVSITRNLSGRHSNVDQLSPQPSPALRSSSPSDRTDPAWNAPRKVSSGISKRIQALNEVSAREANAAGALRPASPLSPDSVNNAFLNRDGKSRGARRAPSPSARPVSFRRPNKTGTSTGQNLATSPLAESPPTWTVRHDPLTSRSSVNVTARIVRPRTEPDQSQLMQSDLTINGNRDTASNSNPNLPPIDIDAAQNSNISSPARSPSSRRSAETQTLHSASGRFGRRKKTVRSPATPEMVDFPVPPGQRASTASINTENSASKTGTRASRFFKRVSTLSGGPKKRRSEQQSGVAMDNASVVSLDERGDGTKPAGSRVSVATHRSDTPPAVVVGDLNVQFPDSLLWKRRIVTISDNGDLQFAIAHAMEIHKGVALKSFPLSGFNIPYAPDVERQELANSVVLELVGDGTTLQLACEDGMTQRQVLFLVRSYWKSWCGVGE